MASWSVTFDRLLASLVIITHMTCQKALLHGSPAASQQVSSLNQHPNPNHIFPPERNRMSVHTHSICTVVTFALIVTANHEALLILIVTCIQVELSYHCNMYSSRATASHGPMYSSRATASHGPLNLRVLSLYSSPIPSSQRL